MPKDAKVVRINQRNWERTIVMGGGSGLPAPYYPPVPVEPPAVIPVGIELYTSLGGALIRSYSFDWYGLNAANADAVPGNYVLLTVFGSITGDVEIGEGVTLLGLGADYNVLLGRVVMNCGSVLQNVFVNNIGDEVSPIVGVLGPVGFTAAAALKNVKVSVENPSGPAYAVQLVCGSIDVDNSRYVWIFLYKRSC